MRLYDKVKAQVLRSKPPNAGAVPRMYTFVMHFAGGRSGEFLKETEAFLRIKCVPARHLAPEVYESLATEMRHTGAQQFPKCRHALLKALFTIESRITASDLRRLFSQKSGMMPQLEECEGLITDVQKLFNYLDVPAEVKLQHQGDFEISLMFCLLQKKEPGKEQRDSLQSVAHSAVMLTREHSGLKTPDLVSPSCHPVQARQPQVVRLQQPPVILFRLLRGTLHIRARVCVCACYWFGRVISVNMTRQLAVQ